MSVPRRMNPDEIALYAVGRSIAVKRELHRRAEGLCDSLPLVVPVDRDSGRVVHVDREPRS